MRDPFRLLAAGVTTAVACGTLAATSAPASAATTRTFSYGCTGTVTQIMMMPIGPPDPVTMMPTMMPMPVPTPVTPTVPLTVTLPDSPALGTLTAGQSVPAIPVTGSLGIDWLVTAVGGALQTVSTSLTLPLSGMAAPLDLALSAAPVSVAGLVGGQLPLTGAIPAFTAPSASGSYPLSMPTNLSLPLSDVAGGLPTTDTLTCTLVGTAVQRVLATVGVTSPADPGTGGTGGSGTSGSPAVDTSRANPCVATPAPRAGQRRTNLRATAARVSWKRRPAVRLTVTSRRRAAKGKVIACDGALKVGQQRLSHGRAVLRTIRFHPGRHRLKLVYLGSGKARPTARMITLRVRR